MALLICAGAAAQTVPKIKWQFGPSAALLGSFAELHVPKGMIHADADETRRFLDFTGNPSSGNEIAVVGPVSLDWFAVISWRTHASLGFDTADPDPDEIARSIRAGSTTANRERARLGRETLQVLEWAAEPVFDERTGRLDFRLRTQESGGRQVENRFVYFLGRNGVLEVELVSEAGTNPAGFESLISGIEWKGGERYQRPGGATPFLVTGIAAALAAALAIRFRRQRGQ
ncbi:MAG: DUF2167 domain-containing protein [Bryobacteraceae bacterium]|nr:DUF2167 domain-containing protein [Bryobacteraceae bacterium]